MLFASLLVCGCTDHSKKLKEKIEAREQAKKDLDKVAEAKRKAAIPVVECTDGLGMVSLAWGDPAKPFRPPGGGGDDDDEALTPQSVWRARPLLIKLPFATKAEAAKFAEGAGTLLEARLVYTLGKPDLD